MVANSRTLDCYHQKKLQEFQHVSNKLQNDIEQLMKKQSRSSAENRKLDRLLKEKENIVNKEHTYYLKVMDILTSYYSQGIVAFDTKTSAKEPTSLACFLSKKTPTNKTQLFQEYLYRTNNVTTEKQVQYINERKCITCNIPQIIDTMTCSYVCENCGRCDSVSIHREKIPYGTKNNNELAVFSYRRYDHFVEILNKFHNLNKSKVPLHIISLIKQELKKNKIETNKQSILMILKTTGHTKYKSQVMQILHLLQNKKLPQLPLEIQQKMHIMFKAIQQPFAKICPTNRTNFLSYSYVIRKFLQILKQTEFIEYFPLLKSREKLYQQDLLWKKICEQLNWKFYPSL